MVNGLMPNGSADGWTSLRDLVDAYNSPDATAFPRVRSEFEKTRKVKILEEYYAPKNNYVVAVLVQEYHTLLVWKKRRYRFKLRYDASVGDPRIAELLRTAHREERKWSFLLNNRTQKILEQLTYTLIVYLLGFLCSPDKSASTQENLKKAVLSAEKEIRYIRDFARDSAKKAALQWYLLGLPLGFVFGSAIAAGVWFIPSGGAPKGGLPIASQLTLCLASGAIGAVISVMIRITRRQGLDVDSEQGWFVTTLAGGFRPIIGAVLGAALFVLIGGGLIPLPNPTGSNIVFFYAGLAFLAGFSERWAQDTIVHSAPKIPNSGEPSPSEDRDASLHDGSR